jgi:hypothetical protein
VFRRFQANSVVWLPISGLGMVICTTRGQIHILTGDPANPAPPVPGGNEVLII